MKVLSDGGLSFEDELDRENWRKGLLAQLSPDELAAQLAWEAEQERKKDPFPASRSIDDAAMDAHLAEIEKRERLRRSKLRYPFETIQEFDLDAVSKKFWILKGIVALGETTAWIAPPGGMKSALMAEMAMCVALGREWHGHKNPMGPAGVLYFALERADLVKRRLMAHAQIMEIPKEDFLRLDIAVCSKMIDLTDPKSVADVVETAKTMAFFSSEGCGPQLLIFDTFAKLLAAGGGDEQQARDQGKVFANIQRIKDALQQPHVALVGHTGKDEARGPRGSNASIGDADTMVQISGDTVKTATVTKANDRPEGILFSFTSATHQFGTDEDGDPITVNIVSADTPEAPKAAERGPRLNKNQQTVFTILHDAGRSGLTIEEWNAAAREAGIGVKRKADLVDIRSALKSKGLVSEYGDRWTVKHAG